jgi:hypothetical protein
VNYNGTGASRTVFRQAFPIGQTDVPGNPDYFYRFQQTVAGTGGTLNTVLQQPIEYVTTLSGQQVRVSFWARVASGTQTISATLRQYFGTVGTPSANVDTVVTSSTTVTTTFQRFTFAVTLPSVSGKTLGTSGTDSLILIINGPSNTVFTIDISQVQVEPGAVATEFDNLPITVDLQLCQRYFFASAVPITGAGNSSGGFSGFGSAANSILTNITPTVPMRVRLSNVTFAIYNLGTQNSVRVTATGASVTGLTAPALNPGSSTGSSAGFIFFSNSLLTVNRGYDFDITLSAEL